MPPGWAATRTELDPAGRKMPETAVTTGASMGDEDRAAQEARAKELRERIERVKHGGSTDEPSDTSHEPESPHDFVERRMRELQDEEGEDASDDDTP